MAFYIVLVPQGIVGMGALGLFDDEVHDPDRLDAEAYAVSPYFGIGVDRLVVLGTAYLGPLEEGVVDLVIAHSSTYLPTSCTRMRLRGATE